MSAPQAVVRVRQKDQALEFQVLGWGTMRQSLCVRRCAEEALARGVQTLRVDLRQCTYLDSTFLGTLLCLQRAAHRLEGRRFALVSPSADCCRLLRQLGVEDFFATEVRDDPAPEDWTELTAERDSACAFNQNVLQAHEELANLGGTAGQVFGPVARQLRREGDDPGPAP
jgi:anti-anti-sigma regulatory factor